jgi:sortase A
MSASTPPREEELGHGPAAAPASGSRQAGGTGERRRPGRLRRVLRALSTAFIVAGLLLVADAAATVLWQEPVTWYLSGRTQAGLGNDLERLEATGPTPVERRALRTLTSDDRRLPFLARSLQRRAKPGEAVGRVQIPAIGLSEVVVAGSQPDDLRKGPGFYDDIGLPGVPGTAAIAGHRTTYGAPFRNVDELRRGDEIRVRMPYATFTYAVERTQIVEPSETWVLDRRRFDRLVLTACHPLFSAAQRIVVFARLERTRPRPVQDPA